MTLRVPKSFPDSVPPRRVYSSFASDCIAGPKPAPHADRSERMI